MIIFGIISYVYFLKKCIGDKRRRLSFGIFFLDSCYLIGEKIYIFKKGKIIRKKRFFSR